MIEIKITCPECKAEITVKIQSEEISERPMKKKEGLGIIARREAEKSIET